MKLEKNSSFMQNYDMNARFSQILLKWEKPFLRDQDLVTIFQNKDNQRYDVVKYAIKKGILTHVRRGLYLINRPYGKGECDPFEMAQLIYGPSYISLESALSYHQWIPEAVYVTTSVSTKRTKMFQTPIGNFRFSHTPPDQFFLNVERVANVESTFLIAEPWKAIADMIYCYKKNWKSIKDLTMDLRIEFETIQKSDRDSLMHISKYYDNNRVCQMLSVFAQELN